MGKPCSLKLYEIYREKGEKVGFALSDPLIHWSFKRGEGSIPFTPLHFSTLQSEQFIAAIEVWVFSILERIKIESSVHPSIIYAQKGITTGFSSFCLVK